MPARPRLVHQQSHVRNRLIEATENRFANQEMSDVELNDFRHDGNRSYRVVGQPMSCMHFQSRCIGGSGCLSQSAHLGSHAFGVLQGKFAIAAGVKLYDIGTQFR